MNINQWRDTSQVIDWFKELECKSKSKFIQVDIKEYYLSITEETFDKTISFALNHTVVSCEDIRIIKHSRKSLLFHLEQAWKKKESSSCFDVTMGSYDGAELCELIRIFMQLVFELIFNDSKYQYEDALRKRGFKSKLTFRDSTAPPNKKMINKKRKIIWFNPPYNQNVPTNIAKIFLKLVDKHFHALIDYTRSLITQDVNTRCNTIKVIVA